MQKIKDNVKAKSHLISGNKFEEEGKLTKAINQYKQSLKLNPDLLPALERLAMIYEDSKELDKAIYYYQRILQLQPNNIKLFRQLMGVSSKVIAKSNNMDEAIIIYRQVLKNANFSQSKIAHQYLGKALFELSIRNGQFDKAVTFFSKMAENQPKNWWCQYNLGLVLTKQDKIDKAIICYQKAIQLKPDYWRAYAELGRCFQRKGKKDEAFQCRIQIIKINPTAGRRYYLSCNPTSPQQWDLFNKTIQENCQEAKYKEILHILYRELGQKLGERGEFSEAKVYYQKSIYHQLQKSKPEFVSQYWDKGKLQKPNFLIIGVMKCGTTSLYSYLCQHPLFLPAIIKEPKFLSSIVQNIDMFEKKYDWSLLAKEKDFYFAHFAPRPEDSPFITGEASPVTIWSRSEQLINHWFPNIKMIVILRNPISRAISHYNFSINEKKISLNQMILSELEELEQMEKLPQKIRSLKYINWRKNLAPGLYVYYLKRWMNLFPKEQFLVLRNEDLAQNPAGVMKQTFDFLGLPEYDGINYTPRNVGSYPKDIDPDLLSRLQDFYRPHNQKLEEFLGRKFNWD